MLVVHLSIYVPKISKRNDLYVMRNMDLEWPYECTVPAPKSKIAKTQRPM